MQSGITVTDSNRVENHDTRCGVAILTDITGLGLGTAVELGYWLYLEGDLAGWGAVWI